MQADMIEPFLDPVFEMFYHELLQDDHLKRFFHSDDQIKELVERQKQSMIDSFNEPNKARKKRYERLGQFHYAMGIPLFDYIHGMEFLEHALMRQLANANLLNELYLELEAFFSEIKQIAAQGYFFLRAEGFLKELQLELTNTLFYRLHVKWTIDFLDLITHGRHELHNDGEINHCLGTEDCAFAEWLNSKYIAMVIHNPERIETIRTINENYHTTARSILYHLNSGQYYEAFSLLESFVSDSMQIMHLLNREILKHYDNKEHAFIDYIYEIEENPASGYVMVIDVRKLKLINKYQGVGAGDQVLESIEQSIKSFVVGLEEDIVFTRLGSGEFLIYFPDIFEPEEIEAIAPNLYLLLSHLKITYKEHTLHPKISLGVVQIHPQITQKYMSKILRFTLNRAREIDNRPYLLKEIEEVKALEIIKRGEQDIHFIQNALHGEMLEVFFQPIVELESQGIFDLEVLARIRHGDDYITAGAFIDLIHELDVVVELDLGILQRVCEKADQIKEVSCNLFINVSPLSLRSLHYLERMRNAISELRAKGLKPHFELTEQSFLDNIELIRKLHEEDQIIFAVDDFGTGFSSLGTVAELAESGVIGYIKIDGSIVRNILTSEKTYQILDATSYMTEKLKLKSIAEFVENKEIYERVKDLGITYGQGYYFYKPMHIEDLIYCTQNPR